MANASGRSYVEHHGSGILFRTDAGQARDAGREVASSYFPPQQRSTRAPRPASTGGDPRAETAKGAPNRGPAATRHGDDSDRRGTAAPDPHTREATLAGMVRRARRAARLTQEELAQRSGLSVRTISDLERARVSRPQQRSVRALVRALDLNDQAMTELLGVVRGSGHPPVDGANPPVRVDPGTCRKRLSGLLAGAARSTGAPLVVRGGLEAGRGELLDEMAASARRHGFAVLRASGAWAERGMPYATLHLLFTPVLPQIAAHSGHLGAVLRGALGLDGPVPGHQMSVAVAALELVRRLSARAPVLVLVDDVQWIDDASAMVLFFIARRLVGTRITVVFAGPPAVPGTSGVGAPALSGVPELLVVPDTRNGAGTADSGRPGAAAGDQDTRNGTDTGGNSGTREGTSIGTGLRQPATPAGRRAAAG